MGRAAVLQKNVANALPLSPFQGLPYPFSKMEKEYRLSALLDPGLVSTFNDNESTSVSSSAQAPNFGG